MGNTIHHPQHTDRPVEPLAAENAVTWRMTVCYDGKEFAGWQVQPGQRTVQGSIQQGLEMLLKQPITIHGSGRTDTGVHAVAQVFHFKAITPIPAERMVKAVNTFLPTDIAVTGAQITQPDFHARYHVTEKTYRYRILNTPVRNPLTHHYAWHMPEVLDVEAMQAATGLLHGTHDFAGFAASGSPRSSTVRTMSRAELWRDGHEILMEFTADGFLYHMVRNLAGTLVEIGMGRKSPAWINEILESKNRSQAGKTAPPQGLYLMEVKY